MTSKTEKKNVKGEGVCKMEIDTLGGYRGCMRKAGTQADKGYVYAHHRGRGGSRYV